MKPFSEPYTILTNRLRGRGKQSLWIEYLITLACAIGWVIRMQSIRRQRARQGSVWLIRYLFRNMLFGYDQGVMGGFLTSGPFERTFPSISYGNSPTMQGFTVRLHLDTR
jgi:hypothetical protein